MLEIELKFRVADFDKVNARLARWNAADQPTIDEADHYFNAPDRDFGKTDEAFRLRIIGDENRITYKGPRQPGLAKTRAEIEIALASGAATAEQFRQLVQHLGYRATAVVRKRRTVSKFKQGEFSVEVCRDEVEGIGRFVEIEIVAEAGRREEAERALLEIARELNLHDSERRSYLHMVLSLESVVRSH